MDIDVEAIGGGAAVRGASLTALRRRRLPVRCHGCTNAGAWDPTPVFHVELRQFPHQARAFNLEREELEERILRPWLAGATVQLQEHRFDPRKAKLAVYEGRGLESSEIGLGRGWANVTKSGTDVTAQLLEAGRSNTAATDLDALLAALASSRGPLTLAQAVAITAEHTAPWEAEQAVWQLLREGRLVLDVAREERSS
jgi:hypothetical protein